MEAKRHTEIAGMLKGREQHGYGAWHQALVDCLKDRGDDEEDLPEANSELTERQWREVVGREFRHLEADEPKKEGQEEEKGQ